MKDFFVGLLVIVAVMLLSCVGFLLLPLLVVLGFFLKWILSIAFVILAIWLVGKVTLLTIEALRNRDQKWK